MKWVKRPKAPGWYWYRPDKVDGAVILHLIPKPGQYDSRKLVSLYDDGKMIPLSEIRGQWFGPLEVPA